MVRTTEHFDPDGMLAPGRFGIQHGVVAGLGEGELASSGILVSHGVCLKKRAQGRHRVADMLEFAEIMARDALERKESAGGHFREEYQTEDGEAARDDENMCHVAVWEHAGDGQAPVLHREPLTFEYCKPTQRSYK